MRIRMVDVLELQSVGLTPAQILEELPDLEMEDIQAVALYANRHSEAEGRGIPRAFLC
jgi:uncharacterized protein (DUF433 family)